MSGSKDFTIEQAVAWVAQEAGRHETKESIETRIAIEEKQKVLFANLGGRFPNSDMAHGKLIELLHVKLSNLEAA